MEQEIKVAYSHALVEKLQSWGCKRDVDYYVYGFPGYGDTCVLMSQRAQHIWRLIPKSHKVKDHAPKGHGGGSGMFVTSARFVVCGYAASHTQYLVRANKVNELELDTENGERILTHPMPLDEAYDYIHG